jgi:hypothetical protein
MQTRSKRAGEADADGDFKKHIGAKSLETVTAKCEPPCARRRRPTAVADLVSR